MIALSNGHSFEYMAASGALEFDGNGWPWEQPLCWCGLLDPSLFTVVIKTLTRHPRKGNLKLYKPWTCVRLIPGGAINAVGLTNPGIEWWCGTVGGKLKQRDPSASLGMTEKRGDGKNPPLIGSILSDSVDELGEMAAMLNEYHLVGLEINASCPNSKGDLLTNAKKVIESALVVKEQSSLPLILKLSVVHDIETITRELNGCVEAYSINSVPWGVVFPNKKSPLVHLGDGGVSGKIAQPHTWRFLEKLAKITDTPVIGPSVWNYEDIAEVRRHGARAVSFGSVFLRYPWRPTLFIKRETRNNS